MSSGRGFFTPILHPANDEATNATCSISRRCQMPVAASYL